MLRVMRISATALLAAGLAPSSGLAQDGSEAPATPPEGAAPSTTESPTVATVHVIAENIESPRGTVRLALCDTGLSVEGCPYQLSVPAGTGSVEATFHDIPPGTYAVVGYQDLNDDNTFGMFFGVPREPYALSGAAEDELVPTFQDAAIPLSAGENEVEIRMKRIL